MFKFAEVTIYEVAGYLLPGAVSAAAFAILAWAIWAPCTALPIFSVPFELWVVLVVVAYYAGHVVQGFGNVLLDDDSLVWNKVLGPAIRWIKERLRMGDNETFPKILEDAARAKVYSLLKKEEAAALEFKWIKKFADPVITQLGLSAERDVYVYREGFYRGSSLSLFVFGVSVWVRAGLGVTKVNFWKTDHQVHCSELVLLGTLCMVASCIFLGRFKRFAQHHRNESIFGLLILDTEHEGIAKEN